MRKICVAGLGYIGLPTALLFAVSGYEVVGVDIKRSIIEKVNQKVMPFDEKGLQELLIKAIDSHRFRASTTPEKADVFIIAVPTPFDKKNRMADLSYVIEATKSIASLLEKGNLVIIESTVPPGVCEKCIIPILEENCNTGKVGLKAKEDFFVAHCPERAIPGNTLYEMMNNDRIIGGIDEKSSELARELYESFVTGNVYVTSIRTAEMVKLMENTYRDINIALANEFAQIAEEAGIDVWEAIELANKHPRVNILKPGPGVGGHCIAVDPWFLTEDSTKSRIISLAREINDGMPVYVLHILKDMLNKLKKENLTITITIFGVAYKGNVSDTRETPALKFIRLAEKEGYKVKIYDPHVKDGDFEYPILPLEDAVQDSDCIVVIADHSEFKSLSPDEIGKLMRTRKIFDTRNCLDREKWKEAGFEVKILGCLGC
ncbi:MAG: nucleotide sugar dehydrogenase [Methanophagales archaeon]|nr:nucleotide sugar dehydrogenase [Methanophagales archaeon]MCW3137014.1 nucleotide sugar dehydrogenase [Methanophagales archaeon]